MRKVGQGVAGISGEDSTVARNANSLLNQANDERWSAGVETDQAKIRRSTLKPLLDRMPTETRRSSQVLVPVDKHEFLGYMGSDAGSRFRSLANCSAIGTPFLLFS